MSKKPELKRTTVRFVGNSADDVTGSCILIESPHSKILLECGLTQGQNDVFKDYKCNSEKFDFRPKEIDFVFVNHCHADHIGLIPLLYKRGAKAKFIMPKNSKAIAEILLYDSAKIMESDARFLSHKFGRNYLPIYENSDVDKAISRLEEYGYGEKVKLNEYVSFRFTPSGHILNSAQLELWITENGATKKLVYTSDLGNLHIPKPYVTPFEPIDKCNLLIGESTYGGEPKVAGLKSRKKDVERLSSAIRETCMEAGGRLLIPVFANDRCQSIITLLYELYGDDLFFRIPILVDSPMALRVCDAYSGQLKGKDLERWTKAREWRQVKYLAEAADSKAWRKSSGSAIILASSGMLNQGRSREWCRELLPDPRNKILFCGYSVENTLASIIKEGRLRKIKISGEYIPNRCGVVDLHSFSSHMQSDDLANYYSSVACERIVLLHGESSSKQKLQKMLQERIAKQSRTTRVVVAQKNMTITL